MVYTAVSYIEALPSEPFMPADAAARERICEARSAKLRESRACAYNLLERAYTDIFTSPMPPLLFDSHGKPSLDGGKIKISISHTEGVCAVAFADGEVGVDVQSCEKMLGKERVLQRFVNDNLQKLIKNAKKCEVEHLFYKTFKEGILPMGDAGRSFIDCEKEDSKQKEAAALWSSLEAVLKCRGGFCAYKNAEELLRACRIDTRYLCGAALSVALI